MVAPAARLSPGPFVASASASRSGRAVGAATFFVSDPAGNALSVRMGIQHAPLSELWKP